jgi:hypothetical protein
MRVFELSVAAFCVGQTFLDLALVWLLWKMAGDAQS